MEASNATTQRNYYDDLAARASGTGHPLEAAVERVASAYLDGKPQTQGKRKLNRRERDKMFWSSRTVKDCLTNAWATESMVLALARYFSQEQFAIGGLVNAVARIAPDALIRAVRYSGLVLNQQSPRRAELTLAGASCPTVGELCRVLDIFDLAHRQRVAAVMAEKNRLTDLSAFDFLVYASLYAFECLVGNDFAALKSGQVEENPTELAWHAINDLLAWKLETAEASSLSLTDTSIGMSVARHLHPILFDEGLGGASEAVQNFHAFHALLDAQIELNEFIGRSADAFCYDDSIRFVRHEDRLEIVEVDSAARTAWQNDGRKLRRLHDYWFHRAMDDFVEDVAADPGRWDIGRPENADANRMAWLRARQARLRLREVYGIADEVTSDSGETVDLFQALLSLNLMSAFFERDFLVAFADRLGSTGDWRAALQQMTMEGLLNGRQNRLPITWSGREAKITNITGWTLTRSQPKGSPRMASAILDFWTYDMRVMAARLQQREPGLQPHLFERPVLKFGATLVQLPWIVGIQNNSTAAINNLRRLGSRRSNVREETQQIEASLAKALESRGFRVLLNWEPRRDDAFEDPGEVDVIATRDGHLFVLEVKSTFIRRSQREAWVHATTTLRRAGLQLQRKVAAVLRAIESNAEFRMAIGLNQGQSIAHHHGWIVDTSIECDHQRFSGFLKISIEEMLIALRDDRHLLKDLSEFLTASPESTGSRDQDPSHSLTTMYPNGFTAERFVEVVEAGVVWDEAGHDRE
jgi:Holliday junction resolvase-like predicted endonuclease